MSPSPLCERLDALLATPQVEIVDVDGGRAHTNVELLASAYRFASRLVDARGPVHGARVLLALPPGLDWIVAFLGLVHAGAVVVPVPLGAPAAELGYFASDSGARLAVADEERAAKLPEGLSVVAAAEVMGAGDEAAPRMLRNIRSALAPAASDTAMLLYTSGTTGRPKGARITHENLAAQTAALREAWGMRPSDTLLHALPMHHLHGIVVAFLTAFTTPCSIRMLTRFDAARVIEEMPRASVYMAVPTMYQRLLDAADALGPGEHAVFAAAARSLRLATSGSAALPTVLAERWRALAGSIPLERYGMTEIGMALSNPLDPATRRPGTVGRPLPSVDVRMVGDDGRDAETGELWVRGPSVFVGYHEREEATREAFRDGWFLTGDVGTRDTAGAIRLLGRTSVDILKSGGEKISALEVEETLRDHPAVREVAVVGMPDPAWGDRVTAAVVLSPGASLAIDELRAWCKERLAPYKVPRALAVVAELPRNAMGKVEKKVLVERLRDTTVTGS